MCLYHLPTPVYPILICKCGSQLTCPCTSGASMSRHLVSGNWTWFQPLTASHWICPRIVKKGKVEQKSICNGRLVCNGWCSHANNWRKKAGIRAIPRADKSLVLLTSMFFCVFRMLHLHELMTPNIPVSQAHTLAGDFHIKWAKQFLPVNLWNAQIKPYLQDANKLQWEHLQNWNPNPHTTWNGPKDK